MQPAGLAALLALTGPVPVPGRAEPLRPDEAEGYLQIGQYLENDDDDVRSEALEAITRAVFDRLTTGTLPSPRTLGEQLGPLVPTKGFQMWRPARARRTCCRGCGSPASSRRPGPPTWCT